MVFDPVDPLGNAFYIARLDSGALSRGGVTIALSESEEAALLSEDRSETGILIFADDAA